MQLEIIAASRLITCTSEAGSIIYLAINQERLIIKEGRAPYLLGRKASLATGGSHAVGTAGTTQAVKNLYKHASSHPRLKKYEEQEFCGRPCDGIC